MINGLYQYYCLLVNSLFIPLAVFAIYVLHRVVNRHSWLAVGGWIFHMTINAILVAIPAIRIYEQVYLVDKIRASAEFFPKVHFPYTLFPLIVPPEL